MHKGGRLPLQNSAVPGVNGPGRTIAHGAVARIATVTASRVTSHNELKLQKTKDEDEEMRDERMRVHDHDYFG